MFGMLGYLHKRMDGGGVIGSTVEHLECLTYHRAAISKLLDGVQRINCGCA